ncbi:MAG: hypothetical protein ACPGVT_03615 [Maricaulaceae bacterium]
MTKPNPKLHYTLFAGIMVQTVIKVLYSISFFSMSKSITENPHAHESSNGFWGMQWAGTDMTLGTLMALGIAMVSIKEKSSTPSKPMSFITQLLAWANIIFVIFVVASIFNMLSKSY